MTPDLFSVYYFSNATLGNIQERECHLVPLAEAMDWFKHHTHNVTAQLGLTARVLMTDSGDHIVAEWKYGQGITWPKEPKS
jgi:hypothetical protein